MRVLLWSARGAGCHYGGPGTSALRLYRRAGDRVQVTLVHALASQGMEDRFEKQIDCSSSVGLAVATAKAAMYVRRSADRHDVLHALTAFLPSLAISLAAKSRGLPSVVKVAASESELREQSSANFRHATKRALLLSAPTAFIAISDEIDKELLGMGVPEGRIARVPNGVDTTLFRVSGEAERGVRRQEIGLDPDLPVVLFSGALVRRKRPHLILAAARLVAKTGVPFQIVFAGPALDADYMRELCELKNLIDGEVPVTFLGHRSDMPTIYAASDIFVLPTVREGMPNALLEAQAAGLPAVVTKASGIADVIVEGETGFIEPPDDAALAERIRTLLTQPAVYSTMSIAARRRVERYFDSSVVIDAHMKIFEEVRRFGRVRELGLF